MPEINGIQLSRALKAIRPDIPVVLSTGFSELIRREQALSLGFSEYLLKPMAKDDLARIIRKVLT